jgi:hypothetical protein
LGVNTRPPKTSAIRQDAARYPEAAYATESVPAGAPAWITPALIASTLDVWQPHFAKPLTTADAIDILSDVGRLMDILES